MEQTKNIENIEYIDESKLNKEEKEYFEKIGENIIRNGKYAVVTMAGGQRNKTRTHRPKRNFFNWCKTKA